MEYQLIRSRRKTLEISVKPGGNLVVRAPLRFPKKQIEAFLLQKQNWILEKQKMMAEKPIPQEYSPEAVKAMTQEVLARVLPRVEYFAALMGAQYSGIRITEAKKRWGSCSGKNSLNFSFLLAEKPPEFLDSVVIHELCHTFHHDHSQAFWQMVKRYDPHFPGKRPG